MFTRLHFRVNFLSDLAERDEALAIVLQIWERKRCILLHHLPSRWTTCKGTLNGAKVQYKLRVASALNLT